MTSSSSPAMAFAPVELFKHGVHCAIEVECAAAAELRAALAAFVRYDASEELDALVRARLRRRALPPSRLFDGERCDSGLLAAVLRDTIAAPGASDFGLGSWSNLWTFDTTVSSPLGRRLVETSDGVSARWLAASPTVPGRLVAASELLAADLGRFDEDQARRAVAHELLGPHDDDLQPEDVDDTHVASLDPEAHALLDSTLAAWRAGFTRAHGRFRRELEAVSRGTDLILDWEQENLAL